MLLRQQCRTHSPTIKLPITFRLLVLTEPTLMRQGIGYEMAHAAALAKYGVSPFSVYTPEVTSKYPDLFTSNWVLPAGGGLGRDLAAGHGF